MPKLADGFLLLLRDRLRVGRWAACSLSIRLRRRAFDPDGSFSGGLLQDAATRILCLALAAMGTILRECFTSG